MKGILKYIGVFSATLALLILLLVLSCTIPQKKIYENSRLSAEFMTKNETDFYNPLLSEEKFVIHNYADAIWLSIAYSIDSEHPLKSALEGKYYNEFGDRLYNINFYRDTIEQNKEANTEYYRYWHGTILFLRPLLTKFTYMDIRYMNVLLLTGLCFALIILLQQKLGMRAAVIFAAAIVSVGFYAVPYCIEYVPMFYIMFISSIAVLFLKDKKKIPYLFLITGICSNFFDFLTVETITLCVPLVLHFYELYRKGKIKDFKNSLKYFIKLCTLWLGGYLFTWMSKWLIASIVLKRNVMTNVMESVSQRTVGKVQETPLLKQLINALIYNIRGLFPFNLTQNTTGTVILFLAVLFVLFAVWFLYRKKKLEEVSKVFFIIALIPYLRYLVMSNHSYAHYWFTFRAQISSIMAVLLAVTVNIDKDLLKKEVKLKLLRRNPK
ncbi:MAG: hypothetical protein MR646_02120 [Agathobacter sp.]|nr:hypothetical protein [Agathobacter sp.]MDY4892847.1 hypothetical protein [Agathobacter sp.]